MSWLDLTDNTVHLVEKLFAAHEQVAAMQLIAVECGASLPLVDSTKALLLERIRYAVIRLSAGSLVRLAVAVKEANVDWRDVLVAAGFANDIHAHQAWYREVTIA